MSLKTGALNLEIDADLCDEMRSEAERLERSISYMAQWAWKLARREIRAIPAPHAELDGGEVQR